MTRDRPSGTRRSTRLHVHTVGRRGVPISIIDGVGVTAPARTVIDLARAAPFEQGVVVADAALHDKLVTIDELAYEVEQARGRRGAARARAVVAFADGRSESVGESRSRVLFARAGLPRMELQVHIVDGAGRAIARCDFGIPELKIAGEFDGKVKYGRLLRPGEGPGEAVFREKRREDAVRDIRWDMVRWVWDELGDGNVVVARWRRAIARATSHSATVLT